ncbi:MAG: TonB-dependent receptor domain-containing protein, partial [Fidelibacterota bacterium]
DERQLRKVAGRWAKKFGNYSVKLSGSYLHAYEWEYISEREFKAHSYPWVGFPGRFNDGKDNNPWKSGIPSTGGSFANANYGFNENGDSLIVGDGEANHGDLDGDGIAGEDWFNGIDDDHDGKVDEDYFWADGIDNAEPFTDLDGDGLYDEGEPFEDWDSNGAWSDSNGVTDENIDLSSDIWYDGYDNDGTGGVDDTNERISNSDLEFPAWANNIENQDIILYNGRISPTYHGNPNPWYDPEGTDDHLRGNYVYDEDHFTMLFDNYIFDYGNDGIPGDPFDDLPGDGEYQQGESAMSIFGFWSFSDFGLDGINNTGDEGEGDGIWQPGDGWIDYNGNGIVDPGGISSGGDGYLFAPDTNYSDVWPPPNGIWDYGEPIHDFGQDGLPGTDDPGEGDGEFAYDIGELDGIYDKGDGCYGCDNDYQEDFQVSRDTDGDGVDDFPDFEVDNRKLEMRFDYNPKPDLSVTFQGGYSFTKTQQVTGIGRYLADGWEYKFFQLRALYKNWFVQAYTNTSYSGNTRGYNLGDHIIDQSSNFASQIQNRFHLRDHNTFSTEFIWGVDLFQTMPKTFGTILNDGPNGYDNDGDKFLMRSDGIDNDGNGLIDDNAEGIDEPDEFDNVNATEIGVYYQSSTDLTISKKWKLITAARLDSHDQLKKEGLLFGPKLGLIWEPNERNMWRLTYGKAFNTPTTTTLFTDIYIGKSQIFDIYSRGNKDGTPYARVGANYPVQKPGYYGCYNPGNVCPGDPSYDPSLGFQQIGLMGEGYFDTYGERVLGAPFFFNITDESAPVDWIPLDTSRYLIFVPEVNGDGVLYTPEESINISDVDPLQSENIQTFEIGYKGFLGDRTFLTFDYYVSYYQNFFSPATIITPTVVQRYNPDGTEASVDENKVGGILPVNDRGANPPYGTA